MKISQYIALTSALLMSQGCRFDTDTSAGNVDPNRPDARPGEVIDAGEFLGPDADPTTQLHLLLSEVKTTVSGTEFIEIYNPTAIPISLTDYYLADNAAYALLPTAVGSGPKPSVSNVDFIARFPGGTSINAGQALVIGINADDFNGVFGMDPDFKIGNGGGGIAMVAAFPTSMGSQSGLTDDGEGIVLFYWDGQGDLVVDVDMVNAGDMTSVANQLANKTSLSQDGPDNGSEPSTYKDDQATMGGFLTGTALLQSFARIQPEAGAEKMQGTGNGRYGHDESTEDIGATWIIIEQATPGVVPATL